MQTVKLGKTGIETNKNAFGALPIQRISHPLCKKPVSFGLRSKAK